MVYLIGIGLTLSFAKVLSNERLQKDKKNSLNLLLEILCMLPMLIVSSLRRYDIGTDLLHVYIGGFERVNAGINTDNFEVGFKTLLQILGRVSQSPEILVFATSFIFIFFTWKAIYDESVNIVFSLSILFAARYYFISLNVIRQYIGMAIVLYAMQFIVKRQYVKFILLVFLAASFHSSLILCLVLLICDRIKLNKKRRLAYFFIIIIIMTLLQNTAVISNIIDSVAGNFDKYTMYLDPNAVSGAYFAGARFRLIQIVINIIIIIIMLGAYDKLKNDAYYNMFLYFELLALLICLLMSSAPLMERVYWIFGFSQIIAIPQAINAYSNKNVKIFATVIILSLMTIFCVYDIFVLHDHQVVPYYFFFNRMI
ncbi:MAG: EpsG family protein [Lactobacillus amylovorus]|jgi:hypothetical protein|nr:EpsG family protein [Lactobacillus amylovorus]